MKEGNYFADWNLDDEGNDICDDVWVVYHTHKDGTFKKFKGVGAESLAQEYARYLTKKEGYDTREYVLGKNGELIEV